MSALAVIDEVECGTGTWLLLRAVWLAATSVSFGCAATEDGDDGARISMEGGESMPERSSICITITSQSTNRVSFPIL
eukprot:COSAG05_NODE_1195_length_5563_cov_4.163193_7_plen_78_part_00